MSAPITRYRISVEFEVLSYTREQAVGELRDALDDTIDAIHDRCRDMDKDYRILPVADGPTIFTELAAGDVEALVEETEKALGNAGYFHDAWPNSSMTRRFLEHFFKLPENSLGDA